MHIDEVIKALASVAPPAYQEGYDNSGLQVGDPQQEVEGVLTCLDVTEAVVEEALQHKANLIVAHHPLIFAPLKSLTGRNWVERTLLKAIRNDIAIYAIHTNLDNVQGGVSQKICQRLGLRDCQILQPMVGLLAKLVTFCPETEVDGEFVPDKVRQALFKAGAGWIGDYSNCSYNLKGTGTFMAQAGTDPFVGQQGDEHHEQEVRIETIFSRHLQGRIIQALQEAHPYEEVAYDIYPLENHHPQVGSGMIGRLSQPLEQQQFLNLLKERMQTELIRYTETPAGKPVQRVAVCGGSGSYLLRQAMAAGADAFVTGDFKYHQFFDAEGRLMIADIGHFESEQFTIELLHDLLRQRFRDLHIVETQVQTNPVRYWK